MDIHAFYENMEEIMKNKENLLEIEGLSKNFQMHLNKKKFKLVKIYR